MLHAAARRDEGDTLDSLRALLRPQAGSSSRGGKLSQHEAMRPLLALLAIVMALALAPRVHATSCFWGPPTLIGLVRQTNTVLVVHPKSTTELGSPDPQNQSRHVRVVLAVERVLHGTFDAPELELEIFKPCGAALLQGRNILFLQKGPAGFEGDRRYTRTLFSPDADYLAALSLLLSVADVPEKDLKATKKALERRTKDGSLSAGVARELGSMLSETP
jgi:hypothetical protein